MKTAARHPDLGLVVIGGSAVVLASLVTASPADAHGSSQSPPSRTYNCAFLHPDDPLCQVAGQRDPQALYDWMEVSVADAAGRHRRLVPDGRLCSAGRPKYPAFDTASARWRATRMRPDRDGRYALRWQSTAPHATRYYRLFLTRPGYRPTQPLRWSDLVKVHDTGPLAPQRQTLIRPRLPERQGRHVLYTVWQRSDSPEAFYSCADVRF